MNPGSNRSGLKQGRTILIFRIGQLGDTLVAMPAINEIRNKYLGHRMILLTDQQPSSRGLVSSWDVLGPTGWFDDVIHYTPAGKSIYQNIENMLSIGKALRKISPVLVFDLSPDRNKYQKCRDRFFFRYMAGIPRYVGDAPFSMPKRIKGGGMPGVKPEWLRLLKIVDGSENAPFRLNVPEGEERKAQEALHAVGVKGDEILLAFGPGSKMPAKRWPRKRFGELAVHLLTSYPDVELLLLGGREDIECSGELWRGMEGRIHNLMGKLSIYGSAAVLKKCIAYVGNDTGTMHLAAMVGTPCVAIFSARDYPGKWDPYGKGHVVLRNDVECSGCMLEECRENSSKCLEMIAEEEVFSVLSGLLKVKQVQCLSYPQNHSLLWDEMDRSEG